MKQTTIVFFISMFLAFAVACSPAQEESISLEVGSTYEDVEIIPEEDEAIFLYYDYESERYGYMNRSGASVIQPQFSYATQFSEGLAFVETLDGANGYIDTNGDMVITIESTSPTPVINTRQLKGDYFVGGVAVIQDVPQCYLINRQGEPISDKYYRIFGFAEGYCAYSIDPFPIYEAFRHRFSYLNPEGMRATAMEFDYADSFSDGFAAVAMHVDIENDEIDRYYDYKWGVIDQGFELVIDCQYDAMGLHADGLIPVMLENKWGYINSHGEIIIPFQFDGDFKGIYDDGGLPSKLFFPVDTYSNESDYYRNFNRRVPGLGFHFSEGLASVCKNGSWGYINTVGEWVIPPQYRVARPFSEGLAAVKMGELWGFINTGGELVIPIQYKNVMNCEDGLIAVGNEFGDFLYYIDKAGSIITPYGI